MATRQQTKLHGIISRQRRTVREINEEKLRAITAEFQTEINNHSKQLADLLGVAKATVISWFNLGRISAWGANEIPKYFPHWTRERLRPDIINWDSVDLSKRDRRSPAARRTATR